MAEPRILFARNIAFMALAILPLSLLIRGGSGRNFDKKKKKKRRKNYFRFGDKGNEGKYFRVSVSSSNYGRRSSS